MPLIKPRTRGKQFVRVVTRLDRENHETLYAYAQFIAETAEYVLNQLVDTMLAKDKEFIAWRAEHPESYVPLTDRERRKQKQAITGDRARSSSLTHAGASTGVAG
jgi:hypothetical protein